MYFKHIILIILPTKLPSVNIVYYYSLQVSPLFQGHHVVQMLKYCHVLGYVTLNGIWIGDGFIYHLYIPPGTTSNYSTTANLHNSQITTASAKPFSSLLSSTAIP
jgi:hypothetical protein